MSERQTRALIVEDDASWQQILSEILTDYGLQVDTCETLDGAISALRANPYRLAMIDLSLRHADYANQDGLAVLDAVRRYAPDCVAIMLTGFASVEVAVSALQDYGAYTCLRKENFRRAAFKELIDQALAKPPVTAAGATMPRPANTSHAGESNGNASPAAVELSALLIEDDAGWQSLLCELLEECGYGVQLCNSFGDAIGRLKRESFHLAVADLSLASSIDPDQNLDGFRLLAYTQQYGLATIVVSGYADPGLIERAYNDHSIFACIEKQAFDRSAFLETVRLAGQYTPTYSELEALSDRELDVLSLLAQGLTNKEIAVHLFITTNTVKRHIKSIFAKLEVSTRSAASAKAVQLGLGSGLIGKEN